MTLRRRIGRSLIRLGEFALTRTSRHVVIDGMDVFFVDSTTAQDVAVERVRAACQLIQQADPVGWRRVHQTVRRIFVDGTGSSEFVIATRSCRLSRSLVLEHAPIAIAMTLVHEAAHARLHAAGIDHSRARMRRIEVIAANAERKFMLRLPDDVPLRDWYLRQALHRCD